MDDAITLSFDTSPLGQLAFFQRRLVEIPHFDPPALRDDVRLMAQRAWLDRARSEYVGVMIARKFWGLLIDVNAPLDIQELALKMVLDEQRHAHLCIMAARSLGAAPEVVFDLWELQQPRTQAPIHEQVMEMVIQTYAIGEVTALALIKHALSTLPDSGYRTVLKEIAGDEVLHARIGPALLTAIRQGETTAWLPWPGDAQVSIWANTYLRAMAERDVVEDDERQLFEDRTAREQLMAVGIPPSDAFKTAYDQALRTDVLTHFDGLVDLTDGGVIL